MRLLDEFRTELRGVPEPGTIEVVGTFGDLLWSRPLSAEYLQALTDSDPAFIVWGRTRYVALGRIQGQLRCFAGRIDRNTDFAKRPGVDVDRLAQEPDAHELSVFETVSDAFAFTREYLGGKALEDIAVIRKRP